MSSSLGPSRHRLTESQHPYTRTGVKARVPAFEEDSIKFEDVAEVYDTYVRTTKEFPTVLCQRVNCDRTYAHWHERQVVELQLSHSPLSYLMTPVAIKEFNGDLSREPVYADSILSPDGSGAEDLRVVRPRSKEHEILRIRQSSHSEKRPIEAIQRSWQQHNAFVTLAPHEILAVAEKVERLRLENGACDKIAREEVDPDAGDDRTQLAAEGLLPAWSGTLPINIPGQR